MPRKDGSHESHHTRRAHARARQRLRPHRHPPRRARRLRARWALAPRARRSRRRMRNCYDRRQSRGLHAITQLRCTRHSPHTWRWVWPPCRSTRRPYRLPRRRSPAPHAWRSLRRPRHGGSGIAACGHGGGGRASPVTASVCLSPAGCAFEAAAALFAGLVRAPWAVATPIRTPVASPRLTAASSSTGFANARPPERAQTAPRSANATRTMTTPRYGSRLSSRRAVSRSAISSIQSDLEDSSDPTGTGP